MLERAAGPAKSRYWLTTYYRWKARLELPVAPEAQRTRELQEENERLKLLVAELAMDRRML